MNYLKIALVASVVGATVAGHALEAPRALAISTREGTSTLDWYEAGLLTREGCGFSDTPSTYSRLPARARDRVTSTVWNLSKNSAGVCLRFVTDSTTIGAIWNGGEGMNHMALTGSHGLDLYVREDPTTATSAADNQSSVASRWKFVAVGRPKSRAERTIATLTATRPGKKHEYMLYLPLYHTLNELKIGIGPGATIAPAPPRDPSRLPIVFYGTSMTQGGCASRAGMCHVALIGRALDRETINLGFSGSGKSEPEMAELVAEVPAAIYVIEPLPNMTPELVMKNLKRFVEIIRERRPDTPILMVENPLFTSQGAINVAMREVYKQLQDGGVSGLSMLESAPQLAGDENGTVDGVHPTDLGFYRMAKVYEPVLNKILSQNWPVSVAK